MGRVGHWVLGIGGGATALVALVGAMHLPAARPYLEVAQRATGACPVVHASPEELEALRKEVTHQTAGEVAAPLRPALTFALGESTPDSVRRWAKENDVSCDDKRGGALLRCVDVPARAIGATEGGPRDEVMFAFATTNGPLVNVTATRFGLSAEDATASYQAVRARLVRELGLPSKVDTEVRAEDLRAQPFATAALAYRFTDYQADLSATNIPERGVLLREHYMAGE